MLLLLIGFVFTVIGCGNEESDVEPQTSANGNSDNIEENSEESSQNGDSINIVAGVTAQQEHPLYQGLVKWKELVEERSNGELTVETYHIGQLGDDRTMIENVQLGSQDVVLPSTAPLSNFVPEFSIFDFPFIFQNEQIAETVLDGEVGQKVLDLLEEQDLVGLAYFENGFRNVANNIKPIETAEDFEGLSIRTMESDFHVDIFRALGANPTPMQYTEVFTALQQGIVDGHENPVTSMYTDNMFEVQKYLSKTRHLYVPVVFIMGKQLYDSLSPEHQQLVREAAKEATTYQRELIRAENEANFEKMQEEGMEVNDVAPEERTKMFEMTKPVTEEYAEELGQDLVEEMYNAIEEAENSQK